MINLKSSKLCLPHRNNDVIVYIDLITVTNVVRNICLFRVQKSKMLTSSSASRRLLCIFLVTSLMTSCSYGGCFVNFGRRGCTHRIVHGVAVMCDGQGIETALPQNLPHDTVYLSLSNFNLTRLTKSQLDRFSSVQCLTVADSRHLTTIDVEAFSGLEALVELTLDGTRLDDADLAFIAHPVFSHVELLAVTRSPTLIRVTDHGAARSLHALKTLQLRDNSIEDISAGLFTELRRLERLDLTGNRLTSLNWTSLSAVTQLNALLLAGNRLQTVPGSAHSVFFAVKELTLSGNPLHCNCQLDWLREFYSRSAVDKTVDSVYCAGPERLALVADTTDENFQCSQPEQPVISWTENEDGRVEVINLVTCNLN